jgi:hypothetical protein
MIFLNIKSRFYQVRNTKTVSWVRRRKKKPVISNTGKFFCFNNKVSNLYNDSVVAKIYGMSYIFTLLMFRKPNKTTIASNNKSDRPQVKIWDTWKTLQYLNINDSFHLKDLEISKYQRESKERWIHFKSSHTRQFST